MCIRDSLAKLAGGVAQINVGAASEAELKEKKARVEDALHATRAAVAEGVVPGGGVSFIRARASVAALKEYKKVYGKPGKGDEQSSEDVGQFAYDFAAGIDVVYKALSVPTQTIADVPTTPSNRRNGGMPTTRARWREVSFMTWKPSPIRAPIKIRRPALTERDAPNTSAIAR